MTVEDETPPEPAVAGATAQHDALVGLLRPVLGFLANVTVLTALLVYFGWRRSETQAERLGIDQSILGMSTQDYVLRSVGPVFWLLLVIGVIGVAVFVAEPWVTSFVQARLERPRRRRVPRVMVVVLGTAWLTLPLLVYLLGFVWRSLAYILFPASFAIGVVMLLYVRSIQDRSGDRRMSRRAGRPWLHAFGGLLVLLSVFWMASNYAEVLGVRLARDLVDELPRRPEVVVTSHGRLHLEGPGVVETVLDNEPDEEVSARYRYTGLRLLEHTGGKVFLIPDEWTTAYGVVFALRDDDPTLRFDFIRDRR